MDGWINALPGLHEGKKTIRGKVSEPHSDLKCKQNDYRNIKSMLWSNVLKPYLYIAFLKFINVIPIIYGQHFDSVPDMEAGFYSKTTVWFSNVKSLSIMTPRL